MTQLHYLAGCVIRIILFKLLELCGRYPAFAGNRNIQADQPTVLVCGHAAGPTLYGAERSFLDILDGFATLGFNVLVAIPLTTNRHYLKLVQRHCHLVTILPLRQWTVRYRPSQRIVDHLSGLIQRHHVHAVHANTIMLREPLMAARQCSIPGVVHVREALHHDTEICRQIGLPAEEIHRLVLESVDYVIANSAFTADNFSLPGKTFVVPNTVDIEMLDIANQVLPEKIEIGLISSNTPKKGIHEIIDLARLLAAQTPQAHFRLIGPVNKHICSIQKALFAHPLPNLTFAGYADTPLAAIRQVNIVLNLSNFEESFGRTVLEAMAARRPVLVYDWGALPELVEDGVTGCIVPYRDIKAMAQKLTWLCNTPERIALMGEAGRKRAVAGYGKDQVVGNLAMAYSEILGRKVVHK